MQAMVKTQPAPESMEFQEVPRPQVGPNDVLIQVKVTSICGTDVHIYNWDKWSQRRIRPPLIQGHEFAGEVIEVGSNATWVHVGDYVSAEGHIACNNCFQCRTGMAHVCQNMKIIGIDREGSFAEYIVVPENQVWKNSPDLKLEFASIQDPLGNAIQSVFNADVPGNSVAIWGCGPIGLMCVAICKAIGARQIFAVGHKNRIRIELARKLGAHFALGAEDDVNEIIMEETDGGGVDEVLEMSGNGAALNQALKVLRPGGGAHLLGIFPDDVSLDLSRDVIAKAARIYGIHGRRMYQTWYRMAGLLESGILNLDPIITHRLRFSEFPEAMDAMVTGKGAKVVMFMD